MSEAPEAPPPVVPPRAANAVLHGSLIRVAVVHGLPLALAMASHGLFNLVDLIIVGRLGQGAIAAVTVGGMINTAALLVMNGVAGVAAAHIARLVGEGRAARAAHVARETLILAFGLGVVLGGGIALLAGPLTAIFQLDAGTEADARRYLVILALGSPAMFLLIAASTSMRAAGRAAAPAAILVGTNILNLGLDIVLVFGLLGFPRLGVEGAAYATAISWIVGAVLSILLLVRRGSSIRPLGALVERGAPYAFGLLLRGLPSAAQFLTRVASTTMLLALAAEVARERLGETGARDVLDGVGVCIRVEMVVVFLMLGFGQGAATLVGQNIGAANPRRAASGAYHVLVAAAVATALLDAVILLWSDGIFRGIAPLAADLAARSAAEYFRWTVPAHGLIVVGIILSQAMNGAGSTRTSLAIDAVAFFAVLFLAARHFSATELGLAGCWLALIVAHAVAALSYVIVFRGGRWQHRRL